MSVFDNKLEYLRGIGPQKAELLNLELRLYTFADLLQYYPFRYQDRSQFTAINLLAADTDAQVKGEIRYIEKIGEGTKTRLVAQFADHSGSMELTFFQGISYWEKRLGKGQQYIAFGRVQSFQGRYSIMHPELEPLSPTNAQPTGLQPIYHLTEKLRKKYIDSKTIANWQRSLLEQCYTQLPETLPEQLIHKYKLISKADALRHIHLPSTEAWLHQARRRLKFEELFYNQYRLISQRATRKHHTPGQVFGTASLLKTFYQNHLPFELTSAQKKVIREIFDDLRSGKQMNRLLQGDVGSGKTIVAFICMLLAIDSGAQACLMAPTEILAQQHYRSLSHYATTLGLHISLLTGSTKKKDRISIHQNLASGHTHIIVGTHALLEDPVIFQNLGFVVVDEQHRFGVAQRAKLWAKNPHTAPHVLVMTATPIPRTLAMAFYGDLDISVINELPKGRRPIKTVHRYDSARLTVFGFMREQLALGRQIYVVYPIIEESEKLDLKHLHDGYESIARAFPNQQLSIVHGRMKAADKDYEMQRFASYQTHILVATTVIEVGVDVPNASVMVIENAERFGLSQLHQLRGRVGRGAEQSYCILMTSFKLSAESRHRIATMVRTTNGFEIAEEDLKQRGPGDLAGTQQSGLLDLLIADLATDADILTEARSSAEAIIDADPTLQLPQHQVIAQQLAKHSRHQSNWAKIS
jgi:ATP-dependent DNA helicase RecG